MSKRYPYTIESGSGEELTFLRLVHTDRGDRLEVEVRAQPGSGPPRHLHYLQEEAMTVTEGKVGFQVAGEPPRYGGPGETVVFPPGVGHRWWNAGPTTLRATGWVTPPYNVEYFLGALFGSMKRSGGKRPSLFDVAFLLTRYRSEFEMLEIPAVVQKVGFPIALVIGRLLGKYRRFADAPDPIPISQTSSRYSDAAV
jgi:quercetin dioxygenase-like cupin family protein